MHNQSTRCLYRGKFLELHCSGHWEFAARVGQTKAIGIIAVTPDNELLLISQHRIPVNKTVIEIPAGLVGDGPGGGGSGHESWRSAARRELKEETGWVAEQFQWLTEGPSSAGMTSECQAFVLATNLSPGNGQELQDGEDIKVHHVPLSRVEPWLRDREKEGILIDPKVWAALYFVLTRVTIHHKK